MFEGSAAAPLELWSVLFEGSAAAPLELPGRYLDYGLPHALTSSYGALVGLTSCAVRLSVGAVGGRFVVDAGDLGLIQKADDAILAADHDDLA